MRRSCLREGQAARLMDSTSGGSRHDQRRIRSGETEDLGSIYIAAAQVREDTAVPNRSGLRMLRPGISRKVRDGTPATFTVVSSSEITTTVPSGATTGSVQVTTPSGTLTSNIVFRMQ